MRTFNSFLCVAALAAATLTPLSIASAEDVRAEPARSTARPVLICATDAATRRAFTREHGAAPVFVSARQALSLRASDPVWTAPRCMTAAEHVRYRYAATTFAGVR